MISVQNEISEIIEDMIGRIRNPHKWIAFISMIYLLNIVAQVLLILQFAKGIWLG